MLTELDILRDITGKLEKLGIQYMLTGSLAMSYYVVVTEKRFKTMKEKGL